MAASLSSSRENLASGSMYSGWRFLYFSESSGRLSIVGFLLGVYWKVQWRRIFIHTCQPLPFFRLKPIIYRGFKSLWNFFLRKANVAKKDDFYTALTDIEKELRNYKRFFKNQKRLKNSEIKAKGIFCLPIYPELKNDEVIKICEKIKKILKDN